MKKEMIENVAPANGTPVARRSGVLGTLGKVIPKRTKDLILPFFYFEQGRKFSIAHMGKGDADDRPFVVEENPLETYFKSHKVGRGIWKWNHYFKIYHRHLNKFRGRRVNILEIGIYSGGSLDMWQSYFGEQATIFGVDIEASCKAYETERIKVFIGDQGSRQFWHDFKSRAPAMDIIIDDGSHRHGDQIVSMKEMLPSLSRGGVYLCEDVHGAGNRFAAFVYGLADQLNGMTSSTNAVQASIESICLYPFVAVIEKSDEYIAKLTLEKRGTEWIPAAIYP
jgi:hypothetical protein